MLIPIRLNNFSSNYNGLLIPISKSLIDTITFETNITNHVYKTLEKNHKNVFVSPFDLCSVITKNPYESFISDTFEGMEKLYKDIMVDTYNYFATKNVVKIFMLKNDFASKTPKNINYFNVLIPAFKKAKDITYYKSLFAYNKYKNISVLENVFAYKKHYNLSVFKDEWIYKKFKDSYYFYDIFSKLTVKEIEKFNQLNANLKPRDTNIYSLISGNITNKLLETYSSVILTKSEKNINTIFNLEFLEHLRREVEIFSDDYHKWAWVYETPDPFDSTTFGIDELLLPETDPRYEDFENIIFDKETMMPRNPVKIIDSTTFIAKYPIELPIEEYADIGNIYEDSAEKWEQYFGIETEIMKEIYLKYYQIWQTKIFDFSTMNMVQSSKKMLELLYTWIDMYYPIEKIPQALRVFRQIRWFTESSIIKNSQYIISYEYDTLKSNLHTGNCDIPNDLDPITNPSMYVDKNKAVIRNNRTLLNQDAYVTFEIDAHKNTYMKFDLFTEIGKGTVSVYLNDVLKAVYTKTTLGIIVEIPYTGTPNYVKIIKDARNNIGEFYIGNITIPDLSFKNLSIEFDPVLRAGNKPIEEVTKKMIECVNLYANRNEMYAIIKRSNLGFTETYKQMTEYWNLHHKNKFKGKRLTIKQT